MELRDKIIAGSLKLFARYGIRSITMDMIAEDMGISKRTIYETFTDKDELLRCSIEAAITEQMRVIHDIQEHSDNVIEAMIRTVKHNADILKSVSPLFFLDLKKYFPDISKCTIESNDKHKTDHIVAMLDRGISEGLFRSGINKEIVAILLSEQFRVLTNEEVFPEEKFSKSEVFRNIVINFMRGIATDEGLALIEKYTG